MCAGSDSTGVDNGDEGLPSPPLDPGALLASTRTNSIEMSHFLYDFLDDLCKWSSFPRFDLCIYLLDWVTFDALNLLVLGFSRGTSF